MMTCVETPEHGKGNGWLEWPNGKTIPFEGGATAFADCRLAYRRLSTQAKRTAEATSVVYWKGGVFGRTDKDAAGNHYPQV